MKSLLHHTLGQAVPQGTNLQTRVTVQMMPYKIDVRQRAGDKQNAAITITNIVIIKTIKIKIL